MDQAVSYGIDSGVGSFAWVRLGHEGNVSGRGSGLGSRDALLESFSADVRSREVRIALGIDAPMWVIDQPEPRFAEEAGSGNLHYHWYLRSGAAATAMSWLVLPSLLQVAAQCNRPITTDTRAATRGGGIYVYEGFATGAFKVSARMDNSTARSRNMTDALTVAIPGWLAMQDVGRRVVLLDSLMKDRVVDDAVVEAVRDHRNPVRGWSTSASPVEGCHTYSMWEAVAKAVGCDLAVLRPDCDVYMFA
ncbi:hypothetical protein [Alicyclobacillus sp. ALC3]|uniref:hypothetical protein n=1 Tax=Alicyclobacillus sp. ALC3 TaxID=2796143 RepID=UPI0023781F1F|nr:hypothetical protein [Alicyclobacillus sp. ALC3]WDL98495.1 hypothetical protein JC200_07390 [Alicyclobacillus sp. ALC3]